MQDLTSGSLINHLLKTTSFMLVSMIFQTLYIPVSYTHLTLPTILRV